MVKHVVMWKLKDQAAGRSKKENALELKSRLEALASKIDEIGTLEVGISFNTAPAAYDVVLYSEFDSKDALLAYQKHPEHIKLITDFLDKIRLDKKVVDYEA